MSRSLVLAVIAFCAACRADGGELQADRSNVVNANSAYQGPVDDAGVLNLVAEINGSEISGAKAALAKLQDPGAVAFAQQLAADHIAMNAALDSLSVKRDTTIGAPPQFVTLRVASSVRAALVNTMPAGPAFDRAWATLQVNAHGDALDSLRIWHAMVKDASVREALGAAIARVEAHLERARALQSSLGSGARGTEPSTQEKKPAPTEKPVPKDTAKKKR